MDSSECRGHDRSRLRRRRSRRVGARTERPDLPNLLVPIDLRDAAPTPPSLFALAETRRVARVAGATVYAIVLAERDLSAETIAQLGRAGADKVLLCEGSTLGAPPLEATHGTALLAAVERVSPLLVLFPAGGAGMSLGPSLAARLGAAFAGPADLEVSEVEDALPDGVGRVFVRFWSAGRTAYRRLDPVDVERPVVAILPAGGAAAAIGSPMIDHDVITCAAPLAPGVDTLASDADDRASIALARVLVVVDPALGAAAVDTLRAAAPAGVAVADGAADASSVAAATPEMMIVVGGAPPPIGTPRARIAVVATDAAAVAGGRAVDVIWRVPPEMTAEAMVEQLAAALPGLALETAP
jgi:electron transfer flavoprotein alpha subunit